MWVIIFIFACEIVVDVEYMKQSYIRMVLVNHKIVAIIAVFKGIKCVVRKDL